MKKILLLIFITYSITLSSQEIAPIAYLGKDYQYYKGSTLMFDPNSNISLFRMYDKLKNMNAFRVDRVYLPREDEFNSYTDIERLYDKKYKVIEIIENPKSRIKKYKDSDNPIFVLRDIVNDQTLYFEYNKILSSEFPFMVSNLDLPSNYFCNKINIYHDYFENKTDISFPYDNIVDIEITTTINDGRIDYYLELSGTSISSKVRQGVYIILSDGSKLSYPEKEISINVSSVRRRSTLYSLFSAIEIDKELADNLAQVGINKYKLAESVKSLTYEDAYYFKEYSKCVLSLSLNRN